MSFPIGGRAQLVVTDIECHNILGWTNLVLPSSDVPDSFPAAKSEARNAT